MKIFILSIALSFYTNLIFCQCDCDKIDQKNGTFYQLCKPILAAKDSGIGNFQLGISGLGPDRYIYMNIFYTSNPQLINGGLTITTNDGKGWICVLVQRDLKLVNNVQTATGLFVTSTNELLSMINNVA